MREIRIRLPAELTTSPTEGLSFSTQGGVNREYPIIPHPRIVHISQFLPCVSDKTMSRHLISMTIYRTFFEHPSDKNQREYEALRDFYLNGTPGKDVAQKFGYTLGTFKNLCCQFRKNPNMSFFLPTPKKNLPRTRYVHAFWSYAKLRRSPFMRFSSCWKRKGARRVPLHQ